MTELMEHPGSTESAMQVLAAARELRETETAEEPAAADVAVTARLRQAAVVQEQVCLELVASQQQQQKMIEAIQRLTRAVEDVATKPPVPDHFPEMLLELSRKTDGIQRHLQNAFDDAVETNRGRVLSAITELRTSLLTEHLSAYDGLKRTFRNVIFVMLAMLVCSFGVNLWLVLGRR